MLNKGRFIVIEGLEGAGKSSAMDVVSRLLKDNEIALTCVREPGGTEIAEAIRTIIKNHHKEPLYTETELLLMFASRVQLLQSVIKPALAAGTWILADRFVWSSYAYQGFGRGVDKRMIDQLAAFCIADMEPDLILFLDVDPQTGLERASQRSAKDRIERESLSFFEKIREGYQSLIQDNPKTAVIDANQSMDAVHQQLQQIIREQFL